MSKSTITYWNVLSADNSGKWESIEGTEGMLEQLTLAMDEQSGDYSRLTRFKAGADTKKFGAKSHDYPEEIYIISGRLYDEAFDIWLEAGHYASRPPGEEHGPFICKEECLVMEVSYPSHVRKTT
jgi:hypothetical protein